MKIRVYRPVFRPNDWTVSHFSPKLADCYKRQVHHCIMSAYCFNRYFSLEEAVSLLPDVRFMLEKAHGELDALRDAVILNKRLIMARQSSGRKPTDADVAVLQQKFDAFEETANRWVQAFAEQGIVLRDVENGLIDFPYQAQSTGEEFFLCWRLNEDGIFYFHGVNEGFAGRHPITLLPD